MNKIPVDDAFLKVNDDHRGVGVKSSKRHRFFSSEYEVSGYEVDMGQKQDAVGSILDQPRE
jgi:hypothetical protein